MKTVIDKKCRQKCRFVEITPNLWLCPHMAWGWAANLRGAEEEGRRLLQAAGGYEKVLARVLAEEEKRKRKKVLDARERASA